MVSILRYCLVAFLFVNCVVSSINTVKDGEVDARNQFEQFINQYKKSYPDAGEFDKRFRIFKANLKKIDALNKYEQGTATYGVTQFADLTKSEFRRNYLGLSQESRSKNERKQPKLAEIPSVKLPRDFDWRDHNAVTAVKNQGSCGSCWAFSAVGNIEGQFALKHGSLLEFSEQELVDCDKTDHGCEGGYMVDAYEAIEKLGGIESESDYPYKGDDEKCHMNADKIKAQVTDAVNITTDETEMAQWLFKNGPISVGVNAFAMQFYLGGVSHPGKFLCNPNDLNHGVLIVGFGVGKTLILQREMPYWLIKNSWGTWWGEHGYYRLYRGGGTCGVNLMASSAIVA